jgi:AcrR family transcriptional regulator
LLVSVPEGKGAKVFWFFFQKTTTFLLPVGAAMLKPERRGPQRVQALREAAADMFLENGYTALSIEALIERVGGSRRNVYAHFGGKEQLFVEAVEHRCLALSEPLLALRIEESPELPTVSLKTFGRALIDIVLGPETLALHRLMIAEGQRFPVLAAKIWDSGPHIGRLILEKWVRHQQERGALRADGDPFRMAGQFLSMATSELQLRALIGDVATARERSKVLDEAIATFMRGWGRT